MISQSYNLEFLTPCFCAGADQSRAEVRAPSIRGKLRWWFRVVGGTPAQESEVFGTVNQEASSSALIVRVGNVVLSKPWQVPHFSSMSNTGYLLYFAKESAGGARWKPNGAIPEGSTFQLHFVWRRKVSADCQELFDLALSCFLMLGSLGLRSTRGLGSFECQEKPFNIEEFERLKAAIHRVCPRFLVELGEFSGSPSQLFDGLGAQLRGLRIGHSAGAPRMPKCTPLGSSNPRQTSAVYLRPVRDGGQIRIVVFEAPAEKVLGRDSRGGAPRLKTGVPQPESAPQGGSGNHRRNY